MSRWMGLGPRCYACSERARRSCCRLLRACFALSGFLTAGLESCLERLLCTSAARAAVCSSVRMERFCVSVDRNYSSRAWHLELEICVVRHHIEFSECGSSEQGVIATAERDYIEDYFFTSEVIRRSEDHIKCYRACAIGLYTWYYAFKG